MKHLLLAFPALIALANPTAFAQSKMELQPNDTVRSILERQVGKPVELHMKSGDKVSGKLEEVTDKLAHLSQLTDADSTPLRSNSTTSRSSWCGCVRTSG
jgi:hypothetical protein